MDDSDKEPIGEGIDEIEDNDDCEDSVQNPATPGTQASSSPSVQDAPENEEFPSGVSAERSSRSTAQNLNTNQLDDIFYSSRQIRKNCSQQVDALLSPRQHRKVLEGLPAFGELLSDAETSSEPSSPDQNIDQRQRVLSMPNTSAGTSSQTSVPASVSQTIERSGSVLRESRASDCVSPLQSSSVLETTQIPQPGRKARKSFPSKSSLPKTITSSRRSFETDIESTSARKAETEQTESDSGESGPRNESFRSKPSPSAAEGTSCDSPVNVQTRKIRFAVQQDETSEPLPGPRRKARKSFASKSSLSKTVSFSSSRQSCETVMEPTSTRKAETERSESDSGESGPRHESFGSKPSPSAAEETSCDSPVNAQEREIRIAAEQDETSEPLSEPLTSRKRERISSGSSGNEDSRKQRKMLPSGDEPSNRESSPSAAEGTSCDSRINAQARKIRIAAEQGETSEPLSEPLTSRKRERISSGSSGNEDSRKQRRMPSSDEPSSDEPSNEESSPSTVGDPLDIHPGEASTSGHRPAVSDNSVRAGNCRLAANEFLSGVFRNIEDSGDAIASTPIDISWDALTEYYKNRMRNWNRRKRSLRGVEFEVQETYEIFVRIVVQSLLSVLSVETVEDLYLIMINYRNFSNFYVNFTNYWRENKIEDIQDEEIRNRVRRIQTNFSDTREAFRNMLEVIQRTCPVEIYTVILGTYEKDLLEGDESFLRRRTP